MKIDISTVSKIVNVLILVGAIVAIVFAILLFNKREEFTQIRADSAATLMKITAMIDGKPAMTAEDLAIGKSPADVKPVLNKVETIVDKIVKQRNFIAENYVKDVNVLMEKQVVPEGQEPFVADYKSVVDYNNDGTVKRINEAVAERMDYFYERDGFLESFVREMTDALEMDVAIAKYSDINEVQKGTYDSIRDRANAFKDRRNLLIRYINEVAKKFPNSENFSLPETMQTLESLDSSLATNSENIDAYIANHNAVTDAFDKQKVRIRDLETELTSTIAARDEAVSRIANAEKRAEIAEAKAQELQKVLDPEGYLQKEAEQITRIDFGVLKDLTGKVTYVNSEYGYVTIDLGLLSQVKRDGNTLNIPLPQNALMSVATSLDPADARYVCKLQATDIKANATVATILPSPAGKISIPKVGDVVYFSANDIDVMRKKYEEEEAKKNAERLEKMRAQQDGDFVTTVGGEEDLSAGSEAASDSAEESPSDAFGTVDDSASDAEAEDSSEDEESSSEDDLGLDE